MLIGQVDFIKTIYYNIKLFSIREALRFPLILGKKTKVKLKRGDIVLPSTIKLGIITFGIGGSSDLYYFESRNNYLGVDNGGSIVFKGKAHFAVHTSCLAAGGSIIFGDKFSSNVGCKFSATRGVEFGRECLLGGNVVVRDSDGHKVYDLPVTDENCYHLGARKVKIGNHVWIGNEAVILKGVNIADGCIVAYGSILSKSIEQQNCIIGGIPGRVIKEKTTWER